LTTAVFQKCIMYTKLDIYGFFHPIQGSPNQSKWATSSPILTFLSPLPHVPLSFTKTNVLHYDLKKDAINEFGIKYWTSNPVWVTFQEHGNWFLEDSQIFPHFALKSREREVKSPCFYYVWWALVVSNTYYVDFVFFVLVLCTLCYQYLWIVTCRPSDFFLIRLLNFQHWIVDLLVS
jgi:hypothetical protein